MKSTISCPPQQYGFRRNRGTLDALIEAEHRILKEMEECHNSQTRVAVVSFDIQKAFDSVSHHRLMDHLRGDFNLSFNAKRWIKNFLTGRTQQVRVNSSLSTESRIITSGVPQGTILGPILYNAATMSFQKIQLSAGSSTILYADDLLLIKKLSNLQDEIELQSDCKKISDYYRGELLKLNGKKTKLMIASVSPSSPPPLINPLIVNNEAVEQVNSLRYLGVTLDTRLNFNQHLNESASKSRQMIGAVGSFLRKWHMKREMNKIYLSSIRPILTYGIAVTYGKTLEGSSAVERVNRVAARMVSNIHEPIDYKDLLSSLQWDPIEWDVIRDQLRIMYQRVKAHESKNIETADSRTDNTVKDSDRMMQYIVPVDTRHSERLQHSKMYKINAPLPRLSRTRLSTTYQMIKRWNSLPENIVSLKTMSSFLRKIRDPEVKMSLLTS
jgi:hypothetical protein